MRTGSGQADDPPAAGQQAEPAVSSPFATTRGGGWHNDLAAWLDRLGWLPMDFARRCSDDAAFSRTGDDRQARPLARVIQRGWKIRGTE